MNAERFQRVSEVFREARRRSREQRPAFLDEACADDTSLRNDVEAMLRADDAPPEYLSDHALRDRAAGRAAEALGDETLTRGPKRIGKYRLIEVLGMGGMGVVYRAEQEDLRRVVALKIMHPLAATPTLVRRFEHEAHILARLRHPGIAQVYEAGVHEDDDTRSPFIAMELIAGTPITQFAREHDLSVRERLELMLQVCQAVQHAHQHGVIHRDLKPANILVESGNENGPSTKVLDFGIARVTDADVRAATLQTGAGQLLGTVQYMSPEQASGNPDDVDLRSDVYSLGVILYELLSGQAPYDLSDTMIHEAVRIIRDDDPAPLYSIDRTFRGDLTTIVGAALEKDKSRRYGSAGELAADVRRYLDDQPISAHPPSAVYQLQKFARRHRALVAATAAVVLVLAAAAIVSSVLAVQARRASRLADARFNDVHEMANAILYDLDHELINLPGALPARRKLVATGQEYLDQLAEHARSDAGLRFDIANAYVKLGDVQGDLQRPNLGDYDGALANYRRAIEMYESLPAESSENDRNLFLAYSKLGSVLRHQNRPEEGFEAHQRALAAAEMRAAAEPGNLGAQRDLLLAHERMAAAAAETGQTELAEAHQQRVRSMSDRLFERAPNDPQLQRDFAVHRFELGMDHLQQDAAAKAETEFRAYLAMVEQIAAADPHHAVFQRDVAIGNQWLGNALEAQGLLDEALQCFERELRIIEGLVEADPSNYQARYGLMSPCCKIGEMHLAAGDVEQAKSYFERYLEVSRSCRDDHADSPAAQREFGVALYKLAEWHRARGNDETLPVDQRLEHHRQSVAWLTQCRDQFIAMRDQGMLNDADAGVPDDMAAEIEASNRTIDGLATPPEARDE